MKSARLGLSVLLGMAVGLVVIEPVAGQSIEQLLSELRLQYRGAVSVHDAAKTALDVMDRRFSSALIEIDRARSGGDDARRSRYSEALAHAAPLADARNRVDVAADSVRSALRSLIDLLVVRQVQLIQLADAAPSTQQRREFDNLLRDVSNELAAREDDVENAVSLDPVAMPEIAFDPRDGPADMLGKAQILERTAARVDTLILSIDEEINELIDRRDAERRRRDFIAGTGRFGDLRPPTGTTDGADRPVQATDSTAAGGRRVTFDERIEARRVYRQNLLELRDLYLFRAKDFRARVRSRS